MSFLDDSSATLQEALAFIDAHQTSGDSSDSPTPRKLRKIGYWKRLKEESYNLRKEATQLERTLTHLQAVNPGRCGVTDHSVGVSASVQVERTFQRRLQAESTNQDLKRLIARNLKVIETMSTLSVQALDTLSPALSALVNRSNRLELNTVAILSRVGLLEADSFLYQTQREIDPQLGPVVETVSSVPLVISKHEAEETLWRRFTGDAEINSAHPYTELAVGGFAKSVSSTFAFGSEHFKLTTHMLLRRHHDVDTEVYVWIASTFLPNTGVEFVEEALITSRDTKPSTAFAVQRPALFQYWYRIHAEERDVAHECLPLVDLELLKESAMRLRSHLSMRYLQSLENSLLSGTISGGLPSCDSLL